MQKMQNTAKIKTCRTGTTERATDYNNNNSNNVCVKRGSKEMKDPLKDVSEAISLNLKTIHESRRGVKYQLTYLY